jgi:integrase
MNYEKQYLNAVERLLNDPDICRANRDLFRRFFEYEEYKLKRINGLPKLDERSYKTLLSYITRFRTANRWFENKAWVDLTKEDIKKVYDGVEDGTILTHLGLPFKDKNGYYQKVFRSKPFEMAGKKDLAREVMEFHIARNRPDVRFIREPMFRQIAEVTGTPEHRALLWLAFDVGENIGSILDLRKRDFRRVDNEDTKEAEYHVHLRREILKRSRTPRTEVTNYLETVQYLDIVLAQLGDDDLLFGFGHRMAGKVLARAVRITQVRCIPGGQPVSLKDLRSSMACDLLSKGWSTDEVNQRLGHKPSSREIDKYVNWLALDRRKPKRKMHENQVATLTSELNAVKDREKLAGQRLRAVQAEINGLRSQLDRNNRLMYEQSNIVARLIEGQHRSANYPGKSLE